jgi:hypothetical protein
MRLPGKYADYMATTRGQKSVRCRRKPLFYGLKSKNFGLKIVLQRQKSKQI